MALILTEEQKLLQKTVRDFAQNELAPRMDEIVHNHRFVPMDLYKRCGELGFWGVLTPKKYGGTDLGITGTTILFEELAKVAPTFALIAMCVVTAPPTIMDKEKVREKYFAGIFSGDLVVNGGVTPPQGGTNPTEWAVLGKKDGDYYVLNGSRLFNSCNCAFDVHMAYGMDEEGVSRVWMLEDGMEGLDHNNSDDKLGMKGSGGGTVNYKNVRVHKDMMGTMGIGDSKLYYNLYTICPMIGLGAAEGLLEKTIAFVNERTHNGKPLSSLGYVRGKLAQMKAQNEACRALIYHSCELMDDPAADDHEAKMISQICKAYVAEPSLRVCNECLKILGGLGYAHAEYYHYAADTLACHIMDLPTDYHYDGIADLMGLKK